jgi:hypothetical protein
MRRKTLCIPFKIFFVLSLFVLGIKPPIPCLANSYVINPSDDGYVNSNGNFDASGYLTCYSNMRGIVEFPIVAITGQIETATLSVNPYALPLWDSTVHVYGYSSIDGRLTSSDYYAGIFLGDWILPNLGYGQDAYFDVTSFMKTVTTPYVGFNLRTDSTIGPDTFSSLEIKYGHPSQLSVVSIPEPTTIILLGVATPLLLRRRQSN